ncbi:carbohydrate ABC transporter permease [Paenibacillus sp. NPDC056579]|uniref:carbohydrate ABC transporter permease n=1 Tax=unclassified Paenibacillus TaxID=185978 RepID=UPI001EF786EB|nr:carbohydrate ABC transporter permease [Paenibacillus sp. H1-7]ULL18291.1 carbohydrate ABC transporter permease [Paenibacillus sp. H1-7]
MIGQDVWFRKIGLHGFLLCGVILSMFPFYWLLVMSTRTNSEIFSSKPNLLPGTQLMTNIRNVLSNIDFFSGLFNTVYVSVVSTVLVLFFCSLAGFFFAKFDFPGKNALFVLLLVTMMIPGQLSLIPSFIIMQKLGWVGTYKALIIPDMARAFGIFWIRQYAQGAVHDDLIQAGKIDGCNHFRIYWHIALPILKPALAFLGIFTFMGNWNEYLWPLIILNNPEKYTLQIVLSQLNGIYKTDYAMVMAGTLMATLPLVVMFLFVSRQFISDIAAGAIKD